MNNYYACCDCCMQIGGHGPGMGQNKHTVPCSLHQNPLREKRGFIDQMNVQLDNYYAKGFGASVVLANIRELVRQYDKD